MLRVYRIKAQASKNTLKIRGYPGIIIKKSFLQSLKRFSCKVISKEALCKTCSNAESCAYASVASPNSKLKPFIIEPLVVSKRKGIIFNLIVLGKALSYEYQIIASLLNMELLGAKMKIESIKCHDPAEKKSMSVFNEVKGYTPSQRLHKSVDILKVFMKRAKALTSKRPSSITLTFKTPTRIIANGKLYFTPPLDAIISLTSSRYANLAKTFAIGGQLDSNKIEQTLKLIKEISMIATCNVRKLTLDIKRSSSITTLRFMTGSVTYSLAPPKDIKAFQLALTILLIGKLIHVGEMTTAGCGKYSVELAY